LDDFVTVIWFVGITFTLEEFRLEFNPMETESMEEAFQNIHEHENSKSN
jgi:hypothetical protein